MGIICVRYLYKCFLIVDLEIDVIIAQFELDVGRNHIVSWARDFEVINYWAKPWLCVGGMLEILAP
jgi:hypothetical protein